MRQFGDLEMPIMEVMWSGDRPYVVREVRERMQYGRPGRVHDGHDRDEHPPPQGGPPPRQAWPRLAYWPVEAREDHDARLMTEVLRSGGDEDVTMRRFIDRVNDEEMESLCSALADARSRRRLTVA